MRANGWQGVGGRRKSAPLNLDPGPPGLRTWWTASSRFRLPNVLVVADFTHHVRLSTGAFVYTRVRHRCVRRADRGLAVRRQTHRVRGVRDPPNASLRRMDGVH